MALAIRWHCRQGNRTADNRDHAGIGIRGHALLALVLDGSSAGLASGQLAREIARRLVDWFVDTAQDVDADHLVDQLRAIHAALAWDHPTSSASYAVLHVEATQPAVVLHAGDCLVGRRDADGRTTWLTQPHTLANTLRSVPIEILSGEPARHRLTRSFRARQFMMPDRTALALDDQMLLVATDGFWAELDAGGQSAALDGRFFQIDGDCDDCGVLSIARKASSLETTIAGVHSPQSIYLRHL